MEGSIAERTDGWRINDHAVCPDFSLKVRGSLGETAGHEIEIFRHGRVDLINETEGWGETFCRFEISRMSRANRGTKLYCTLPAMYTVQCTVYQMSE